MDSLVISGLMQVIAGSLLAVCVLIFAAVCRNPFAIRALWLIVLLKFVVPPLLVFSIPAIFPTRPVEVGTVASIGDAAQSPFMAPNDNRQIPRGLPPRLEESSPSQELSANHRTSSLADSFWTELATIGVRVRIVESAWVCGTVAVVSIALVRIRSFHKLLSQTRIASPELQRRMSDLASKIGLSKLPVLRITDASIPPLVWSVGLQTTLLLPARLLNRLADSKVTAVLAHELTHIRRKDGWVRWLELVAVSLYWWCPLVWFARHKLQEAEERCCDADVLRCFPNLRADYGSALLETLEFLSNVRYQAVVGTGFGRNKSLKRRFEMIVSKRVPVRPNRPLCAAMVLAAAAALFVSPIASSMANTDADSEASSPEAACTITLKNGSLIKGSIISLGKDQIVIKLHADESQVLSQHLENAIKIIQVPATEIWELSLVECLKISLQHNGAVRIATRGDGLSLVVSKSDISGIWEFRRIVEQSVRDVESAYWDLWLAYQDLEAVKSGREIAQSTWREQAKTQQSNAQGAVHEALARSQYFTFRAQVEQRMTELYKNESRLRHLLGLASADGRSIRPSDQPDLERPDYDWRTVQQLALTNRVEMVKQKQQIKKCEKALERSRADDGPKVSSKTRHLELVLGREKAILSDLELEISHQIGDAIRDVDLLHRLIDTNSNQVAAQSAEGTATRSAFHAGIGSLDLVMDSQRREVEAKRAYNKARADYMRAVAQVEARKGSLLNRHGLEIVEEE